MVVGGLVASGLDYVLSSSDEKEEPAEVEMQDMTSLAIEAEEAVADMEEATSTFGALFGGDESLFTTDITLPESLFEIEA
jgi:hypothetical protein